MIISEITTYACDLCKVQTTVWDEDDRRDFENEWHTNLTLDLCPTCKTSARGLAMIAKENRAKARAKAELKI